MSIRVDVEEIEATKSEKFLAVVLALFVLVGGVWTYVKIDDYVRDALEEPALRAADVAAIDRYEGARQRVMSAARERQRATRNLELRREAYRTALDEGRRAPRLRRAYRRAQAELVAADRELVSVEVEVQAAQPAAAEANMRSAARFQDERDREELVSFLLRALLAATLLAGGLWLLSVLRRRRTRYLPLSFSVAGAAAVLAFVLVVDYVTDYVDPLDLGPLVLSLFGIAVTLAAFAALQRYLARRIPYRRVRKRECPFCGYPAGSAEHCEGCGRQVVGECTTCGRERRVGTLHCASCGAT